MLGFVGRGPQSDQDIVSEGEINWRINHVPSEAFVSCISTGPYGPGDGAGNTRARQGGLSTGRGGPSTPKNCIIKKVARSIQIQRHSSSPTGFSGRCAKPISDHAHEKAAKRQGERGLMLRTWSSNLAYRFRREEFRRRQEARSPRCLLAGRSGNARAYLQNWPGAGSVSLHIGSRGKREAAVLDAFPSAKLICPAVMFGPVSARNAGCEKRSAGWLPLRPVRLSSPACLLGPH